MLSVQRSLGYHGTLSDLLREPHIHQPFTQKIIPSDHSNSARPIITRVQISHVFCARTPKNQSERALVCTLQERCVDANFHVNFFINFASNLAPRRLLVAFDFEPSIFWRVSSHDTTRHVAVRLHSRSSQTNAQSVARVNKEKILRTCLKIGRNTLCRGHSHGWTNAEVTWMNKIKRACNVCTTMETDVRSLVYFRTYVKLSFDSLLPTFHGAQNCRDEIYVLWYRVPSSGRHRYAYVYLDS